MQERPIIFADYMIRAILEGRKTQTRRPILKTRDETGIWAGAVLPAAESGWIAWWPGTEPGLAEFTKRAYRNGFPCPYGRPGDRLWVRETWAPSGDGGAVWFRAGIPLYRAGRWDGHSWEPSSLIYGLSIPDDVKWRPAIHMPRWASRITLEIIAVRAQRLQDITGDDAMTEGLTAAEIRFYHIFAALDSKLAAIDPPARCVFASVWNKSYGPRSLGWDVNPWVWAITFRLVDESSSGASYPNSAICGISGGNS